MPAHPSNPCARRASDCICRNTAYNQSWLPLDILQQCKPSPLCFDDSAPQASKDDIAGSSIVLVMGHDPAAVRPAFTTDHWGSYYASYLTAIRLVLSLRRVHTTLPITLLASGARLPRWEALIASLGVHVLDGPNVTRPVWARTWHKGSFPTLGLVSLSQFRSVVFIENDAVVTQNIDHLAAAPTPSFVNHFDDFDCGGALFRGSDVVPKPLWRSPSQVAQRVTLMAGLAVLRPSADEWQRMKQLLNRTRFGGMPLASGDGSSQTVWRLFYAHSGYHELPVRYNAFQSAKLASLYEWLHVCMLHDMASHRSHSVFGSVGYGRLWRNLTRTAWGMVRETFGPTMERYGTMTFLREQAERHHERSERSEHVAMASSSPRPARKPSRA